MTRPTGILLLVAMLTGACTSPSSSQTSDTGPASIRPTCTPGQDGCVVRIEVRDVSYELTCEPVAEALVDVDLPRRTGQPKVKAITAVAWTQGVAVLWNDAAGCGLWALALAEGLSEATATSIRDEIARGAAAFGVTESPMPEDSDQEG